MTAVQHQQAAAHVPEGMLVGGVWRQAEGGGTFPVENPATRGVVREVPDAGPQDASAAMDAAAGAQSAWAATAPRERSEMLRRVYEALVANTEELAVLMTLEMGKPLAQSRGEIGYAAEFFRWFAEEAVRIHGTYGLSPNGVNRLMTLPQPVGPCVFVTPWNFPMAMGARKLAPAMAAGCTSVIKPAQQTPLSMLALGRLLEESGVPDGVVNILTTSSAGAVVDVLLADSRTRKLSFTGSTEVGKVLLRKAADNVLRVSMELGGNAPFIVCADADLEQAVEGAVRAKMRNMGEACTAANRFYVEEPIADAFVEGLAERLGALRVGPGLEDGVDVGPLIDADALEKVDGLVSDALSAGASPVLGGERGPAEGYFYQPTVLSDVPPGAALRREEIFGPVAPVSTYRDDDAVIAEANDTPHGLVAFVFTQHLDRGLRFLERLDTGMVGLNRGVVSDPAAPFGGVKQSGLGREGGAEGIHEFLELKYAAIPA